MIHYNLRCEAAHEFDGWFKDSANFERQAERGLIACPICASVNIERGLMAPSIPRKNRQEIVPLPPASPPVPAMPAAGGVMPDSVRTVLRQLRTEVEKNCDYVGSDFAEEARRIHHGEALPRGIYGESTDAEAEALADEGIEFARIPWLPRTDS